MQKMGSDIAGKQSNFAKLGCVTVGDIIWMQISVKHLATRQAALFSS
jgi:hypothetical protein